MLDLASFLFAAQASERGICIATSNPDLLRQQLYATRRQHGQDFAGLSFIISPENPQSELWIVKNERANAEG